MGNSSYHLPFSFKGGILADQMGLGKSLSMLALIASDIEASNLQANAVATSHKQQSAKSTLLVVPLSGESELLIDCPAIPRLTSRKSFSIGKIK